MQTNHTSQQIRIIFFLILLFTSTQSAASRLLDLKITPDTASAGSRVTVQIFFDRPGQAFPILTTTNPRVFNPGGNWSARGAPSITRNKRLGTTPGCTTVQASWGGQTRQQRVCVEAPVAPTPQPELCLRFSLRNPGNGVTVQSRTVEFRWNTCTNATSYRLMMRSTRRAAPRQLWQGNTTRTIVDVPASFGNAPSWYIEAHLENQGRASSSLFRLRFQQTPSPAPTDTRLDWDETINLTNYPDLVSWPGNIRQRVEGRENIKSIVESRVIVRGDNNRCSACHFNGNGSRRYMPSVSQNAVGGNIGSTTSIRQCQARGCPQNGSWRTSFAQAFLQNTPGTAPISGVKPDYLRSLIQKWVSDGSRP